jgi:hypothetical protein
MRLPAAQETRSDERDSPVADKSIGQRGAANVAVTPPSGTAIAVISQSGASG